MAEPKYIANLHLRAYQDFCQGILKCWFLKPGSGVRSIEYSDETARSSHT